MEISGHAVPPRMCCSSALEPAHPAISRLQATPPRICISSALHPGCNPGANLKSISGRCFIREVAFEWGLTEETIDLPLVCLQGGLQVQANPVWNERRAFTGYEPFPRTAGGHTSWSRGVSSPAGVLLNTQYFEYVSFGALMLY